MSLQLQLPYLNSAQNKLLQKYMYECGEIPDWFHYYNPQIVSDLEFQNQVKVVPSQFNQLLSQESEIFVDSADYLAAFFNRFDKLDIYEVAAISPFMFLPLIISLLEQEQVLSYTPVAAIHALGQSGISSLQAVSPLLSNHTNLKFNKTQINNIDTGSYYTERNGSTALHLMLDSYLGNSVKPKQILHNLYNSMRPGDYLLLQQSIYQPGLEDQLESDYRNWIGQDGVFECTKQLSRDISNEPHIQIQWSDNITDFETKQTFSGVQAIIEDLKIDHYNSSQPAVSLFRSIRFRESVLINYLAESNFKINTILYNRNQSSALFICQK